MTRSGVRRQDFVGTRAADRSGSIEARRAGEVGKADALAALAEGGDTRQDPEGEYAEHCCKVDIATAPLRDSLSYCNGHGDATPGSLAYYGGNRWHKCRLKRSRP